MTRRILTLIVITTMLGALLPTGAALASANATANITSAAGVYPGDRSFTISVSNEEMLVVGNRINAVRIFLPVDQAGITLRSNADGTPSAGTAPTGWSADATRSGSFQFITYRGGTIAPGSSTSFTVPADVLAPLGSDRTGTFGVQVSSDNFKTNRSAPGALDATVRILEIINGTVLPLEPYDAATDRGVRNGTGTAGQRITYGFDVKNHARGAVDVAGTLVANNDLDKAAASDSKSVGAGATEPFRVPVDLGAITGSSNRTTIFTAQAVVGTVATAPTRTSTFTVQIPVSLAFDELDPTRTRSGEGSGRNFALKVRKSGAPAFDLTSSTLQFAGNSGAAQDMPKAFAAGSPASATDLSYAFETLSGTDGSYGATVDATGVDANLFGYNLAGIPVGDIVIDNLAPILEITDVILPKDRDGDQQIAVKPSGDRVEVRGTITGSDLVNNSLVVRLVPDVGKAVTLTATRSGSGENHTFTATGNTAFDASAQNFKVTAEMRDTAGNIGTVAPPATYVIDGVAPVLSDPATILEPTMIRAQFADTTGVRGGCDTAAWSLAGVPITVSEVRLSDGTTCSDGSDAARTLTPDGVRVLILSSPLDQDATPSLTYGGATSTRLVTRVPAKDGAGNDAARQTVQTVTDLIPDAPSILEVRRTNRYSGESEGAYRDADENRYYTAVGGTDGVSITVGGVRSNYRVRILDQNGNTLAERQQSGLLLPGQEGSMDINVPLPSADGVYARRAVFVTSDDRIGLPAELSIALDTALPTIASSTFDGADLVTVKFNEKIVAGSDFSDDWFTSERIEGEEGPGQQIRNVNSVERVDSLTRKLTVDLTDPTQFLRAFYWLQSGQRYEDRAGNRMNDTL